MLRVWSLGSRSSQNRGSCVLSEAAGHEPELLIRPGSKGSERAVLSRRSLPRVPPPRKLGAQLHHDLFEALHVSIVPR